MGNGLEDVVGATTIGSILYGIIFQPWSKEARRRRAEKRRDHTFMRGTDGIKDIVDAVADAPQRMKTTEDKVTVLEDNYGKVQRGNEEAIRAIKATDDKVEVLAEDLKGMSKQLDLLVRLWSENGEDTNKPVDVQKRIAKRMGQGVWLENPKEDGERHD